jgi:hypothetical protein
MAVLEKKLTFSSGISQIPASKNDLPGQFQGPSTSAWERVGWLYRRSEFQPS